MLPPGKKENLCVQCTQPYRLFSGLGQAAAGDFLDESCNALGDSMDPLLRGKRRRRWRRFLVLCCMTMVLAVDDIQLYSLSYCKMTRLDFDRSILSEALPNSVDPFVSTYLRFRHLFLVFFICTVSADVRQELLLSLFSTGFSPSWQAFPCPNRSLGRRSLAAVSQVL